MHMMWHALSAKVSHELPSQQNTLLDIQNPALTANQAAVRSQEVKSLCHSVRKLTATLRSGEHDAAIIFMTV